MALGDHLVFFQELLGRLLEGLFIFLEEARLGLAAQRKIPVFRELLREDEVVLASGGTVLAAINGSGAVPGAAVAAPVDLDKAAQEFVPSHLAPPQLRIARNRPPVEPVC